jgi:5'-3' exonuclease
MFLSHVSQFPRWLSKKYPKVVEQVIEDVPAHHAVEGGNVQPHRILSLSERVLNIDSVYVFVDTGTEEIPIDMSQRNPNGIEFG